MPTLMVFVSPCLTSTSLGTDSLNSSGPRVRLGRCIPVCSVEALPVRPVLLPVLPVAPGPPGGLVLLQPIMPARAASTAQANNRFIRNLPRCKQFRKAHDPWCGPWASSLIPATWLRKRRAEQRAYLSNAAQRKLHAVIGIPDLRRGRESGVRCPGRRHVPEQSTAEQETAPGGDWGCTARFMSSCAERMPAPGRADVRR